MENYTVTLACRNYDRTDPVIPCLFAFLSERGSLWH